MTEPTKTDADRLIDVLDGLSWAASHHLADEEIDLKNNPLVGLPVQSARVILRECARREALLAEMDTLLTDAWQDLHEWVRHARDVRGKVGNPDHSSFTATEAGIAKTEALRQRISALKAR